MSSPLSRKKPTDPTQSPESPAIRAEVTAKWREHKVTLASVPATTRISDVSTKVLGTVSKKKPSHKTKTREQFPDGFEVEFVPRPAPSTDPNTLLPDAPVMCSRPLSSGVSTAVRISSEEVSKGLDQAFLTLKELVLPQASHCEFDLQKASVRYAIGGIEQPNRLDLRKLIAESPNPEEALKAAKELQKALALSTGEIITFDMDDQPINSRRISLRGQEGSSPYATMNQLPALPATETIQTGDSSIKKSYQESIELVIALASRASLPENEILAGLNRIGCMESVLSSVTSRLRKAYASNKTELEELKTEEAKLRTELANEADTAQQERMRGEIVQNISKQRECNKNLIQLDELLRQTNIDRLASYMGLMFAPDTSKATTSGELIKAADARAIQIRASLNTYLAEKEEKMRPSLKQQVWAKLPFTKPLDEIKPDLNYAVNVSSLVYATLPPIEAQRGSESWMVRNAKPPLAPSKEAAWVALVTSRDRAPVQLVSLFKEFAEITCPGDAGKQSALMSEFTMELQTKKSKPPLTQFTTDNLSDELWNHYTS